LAQLSALASDPVVPLPSDHDRLRAFASDLHDERSLARPGYRMAMRGLLALIAVEVARLAANRDRIEAPRPTDATVLSLRRLIEGARHGAALACYRDEGRDLGALIDRVLAEHELAVEPDARAWLVEHLGADRGVTRGELAKLALYCDQPAPGPAAARRVTLEAAAQVVGDSAALELDDLVHAASAGAAGQVERCLDRLLAEGQAPVRLLRALASHMTRLHQLACRIEGGLALEQVLEQARPPIHFRRKASFQAALRRWPAAAAGRALKDLLAAEIGCKTTGWPAAALCRRAVLGVCLEARGARRPSG